MIRLLRRLLLISPWGLALVAGSALGLAEPQSEPQSQSQRKTGQPERARGEVQGTLPMTHGPVAPGSAVYPQQRIPLRFDHGKHLSLGMQCHDCHRDIRSSTKARDFNFPRGQTCDRCHGAQHPPAEKPRKCGVCHTRATDGRVTAAIRAPTPLLRFNHALHLRRGASCADCHGDMEKVRLATTLQLPREAECLTCHDGIEASSRCDACHPATSSGQLITRARDDRVSPALVPRGRSAWGMEHDLAFVEDHASIAKASPDRCESCHQESFCQECHAGAIRPLRIHPGDYVTRHAMDARGRTQDCQSCHRVQTFCLGCHERLGFGERAGGAFGVGGGLQFHPEGWSGPPGMSQTHAFAAQRNITACASCHTEDSCLACHATTGVSQPGFAVSPHGPGFADSARCTALASRNRRACLKCHPPGEPQLDCRGGAMAPSAFNR